MDAFGFSRRSFLGVLAGGMSLGTASQMPLLAGSLQAETGQVPFRFCLNTATIRAHKLSLREEIELAARVGYDGIEPWTREIEEFLQSGGSLRDLRKLLEDTNLKVESAIGFPSWMVDDDQQRAKGFEQMKREMEWIAELGGKRIAAPPAGAYGPPVVDLRRVADRYRQLLELGEQTGVIPQLEIWGASANLSRLSEAAFVLVECGHPLASGLFDVFHIYRGGSRPEGLRMFNGATMHVFHMNDYPAEPPREKARDSDRVFPGDGVGPLSQILQILWEIGFRGALSVELFNPTYAQMDVETVARRGLQSMQEAVKKALRSGNG